MKCFIYVIVLLILSSCSSESIKTVKESIVLEEIVYQRTEGLIILDYIVDHVHCEETVMICHKIENYYRASQLELIDLCKNRELNLTMTIFQDINQDIESPITDKVSYQYFLIEKLLDNLKQQKTFYLQILEDQEMKSLHYYTLESYLQMVCFVEDINFSVKSSGFAY